MKCHLTIGLLCFFTVLCQANVLIGQEKLTPRTAKDLSTTQNEGGFRTDPPPDFLSTFVEFLFDSEILNKDDLKVYARQSRSDSPFSELAFDVFKEVVSELLTATVGSYFGVETSRTDTDDFNIVSMVMNAVKKNSIQKRMGCPT